MRGVESTRPGRWRRLRPYPNKEVIKLIIRRMALAALLTAGLTVAFSSSALAAKGHNDSNVTPSISLNAQDPSFGGTASFSVAYPAMKWVPEVSVSCSVAGQQVYLVAQTPTGSGTWTPQFTLWSQNWADLGGGPASCTANLYYYTWQGQVETGVVYLANTSFVTS